MHSSRADRTAYELVYWRDAGLARGTDVYRRMLAKLGIGQDLWAGRTVADVGCGPLGGVLSAMPEAARRIAVDPLIADFRAAGYWHAPDCTEVQARASEIPDAYAGTCDLVVSINALDHTPEPGSDRMDDGLRRVAGMLAPAGVLGLMLHLRTDAQLDVGHEILVTEDRVRAGLAGLVVDLWTVDPCDTLGPAPWATLWARCHRV